MDGSGSLSARRAWIEILNSSTSVVESTVALRKESVDRNLTVRTTTRSNYVALRKESVDRNSKADASASDGISRSPQGERG